MFVQRGSAQVAITSCYSISDEKVKGQPLLPADDARVSQGDVLKSAGSAGGYGTQSLHQRLTDTL